MQHPLVALFVAHLQLIGGLLNSINIPLTNSTVLKACLFFENMMAESEQSLWYLYVGYAINTYTRININRWFSVETIIEYFHWCP